MLYQDLLVSCFVVILTACNKKHDCLEMAANAHICDRKYD